MAYTEMLDNLTARAVENDEYYDDHRLMHFSSGECSELLERFDVIRDFLCVCHCEGYDEMAGMGLGRRRPVAKTAFWSRKRFGSKPSTKDNLSISNKDLSGFKEEFAMDDKFVNEIRVWSSSMDESHWDQRTSLEVLTFFVPWFMIVNALDRKASELAQRSLANAILMMVFSGRDTDTSKHIVSLEQTVNLPVGADSPYKLTNTIADVFVGLDLEPTLSQEIEIFCNANKLAYRQLQCINVVQSDIRIGTFFAEWKKDDVDAVRCQGAYNALAIQSQRRALLFEDRPVYGVIMNNGIICLMVSYWIDTNVGVYYTEKYLSWDIRRPGKVVELYYFLCTLKCHIDEGPREDITTLKANQIDIDYVNRLSQKRHAAFHSNTSSLRTERKESDSGSRRGPRDANSGDADVDGVERFAQSSVSVDEEEMDDSDGESSSDSVSSTNAGPMEIDTLDKIYSIDRWRQGEEAWVRKVENLGQILDVSRSLPS